MFDQLLGIAVEMSLGREDDIRDLRYHYPRTVSIRFGKETAKLLVDRHTHDTVLLR